MAQATFAKKIAIIGGGHIGTALAAGLARGGAPRSSIAVIDKGDSVAPVSKAALVFLAVRPSVVPEALAGIRHLIKGKLVVSLAAGVTVATLKKNVGAGVRVARMMPNIPIAVNEGVVGVFSPGISSRERALLKKTLSTLGLLVEVRKESEFDTLTLISGCGPGIAAYFVELLAREAGQRGIKGSQAEQIAFQAFLGTLRYMQANLIPAATMQKSVATKGGVTEAILSAFRANGLDKAFARSLKAGEKKIKHV